MTTRVYCIRHGETAWNATGRWQGHAPVPLSDDGLKQAEQLAAYLARTRTPIDVLYTSDLLRARQTANAIAAALLLPAQIDTRLREVDLGEWQGLTRQEVEAWDPERYAAFSADWYTIATPNGESRNELKVRIRAAFDDISERHRDQTIALVSHGGTLGMLIESLFGPIERPSLSNTSLTIVESDDHTRPWNLVKIAWSPHLEQSPLGETW